MRCGECGSVASPDHRFCGVCGARVALAATSDATGVSAPAEDGTEPSAPGPWAGAALAALVLVGVLVATVAVPRFATDPPDAIAARGEAGGTGHFPVGAVDPTETAWRTDPIRGASERQHLSGLVAVGDTVVVAAEAGLVGIDAVDGTARWRAPLGWGAGQMTAVDGLVVVPTVGGLAAIRAEDGEVIWRVDIDGGMPHIVASGGSVLAVVVGTDEIGAGGRLVGLDVATGDRRWDGALADDAHVAPWTPRGGPETMGTDGVAVVRVGEPVTVEQEMPDGSVESWVQLRPGPAVAIDLETGEELWRTPAGTQVGDASVSDAGAVMVVYDEGDPSPAVVVHDIPTGEVRWRAETRWNPNSVLLSDDVVHVAAMERLFVLDAEDGREIVRGEPRPASPMAMRLAGEHLVLDAGDSVVVMDPSSLEVHWERERSWWGATTATGEQLVEVSEDGVVGLDLADGSERWTFTSSSVGSCEVSRFGGELVVASAGNAFTLDAATGAFRRDLTAVSRSLSETAPGRDERRSSVLLASDGDGEPTLVTLVGPRDGRLLARLRAWPPELTDAAWDLEVRDTQGPMRGDDGTVVIAGAEPAREVVARDVTEGGEERWSRPLSSEVEPGRVEGGGPPPPGEVLAASAGRLFVVRDGALAAWDLADGGEIWAHEEGPAPHHAVARDDVLLVVREEGVSAVDPDDGVVRWTWEAQTAGASWGSPPGPVMRQVTTSGGPGVPALSGDLALIPEDDQLVALDVASGDERWAATMGAPVVAGVSVAGDRVYVATAAGIEVLELDSGEARSQLATDRLVISPPFIDGDRLYVCLADGTVAAYE